MPVKWSYRAAILIVETIGDYELFDGRLSEVDISTADVDWRVQFASGLRAMGFSRRCAVSRA